MSDASDRNGSGSDRKGDGKSEKIQVEYEMCPKTKRWQPTLFVFHPDASNPAKYRTQYLVGHDGNNRKDPDQRADHEDPAQQVYCLLINGKGEIWHDQATDQPVILPAAPLVMVQADETHVKMADAVKLTGYSQQTIWRAVQNGDLKAKDLDDKNRRYSVHDLRQWQEGRKPQARKKGKKRSFG